ncbi:MAG: hypothetical protein NC083_07875, partial [Muribaculum sp.]|nr:hypothetical protein [Muribaculum sp.]
REGRWRERGKVQVRKREKQKRGRDKGGIRERGVVGYEKKKRGRGEEKKSGYVVTEKSVKEIRRKEITGCAKGGRRESRKGRTVKSASVGGKEQKCRCARERK